MESSSDGMRINLLHAIDWVLSETNNAPQRRRKKNELKVTSEWNAITSWLNKNADFVMTHAANTTQAAFRAR